MNKNVLRQDYWILTVISPQLEHLGGVDVKSHPGEKHSTQGRGWQEREEEREKWECEEEEEGGEEVGKGRGAGGGGGGGSEWESPGERGK